MKRFLLPFAVFLVLGVAGGVGGVVLRLRLSPPPAAAVKSGVSDTAKADSTSIAAKDSTFDKAKDSTHAVSKADSSTVVAASPAGATASAHAPVKTPSTAALPRAVAIQDSVKPQPAATTAKASAVPSRDTGRLSIAERFAAAQAADSLARVAQQRLGKVLGSMPAKDAARVIEKLADAEAATALSYLKEKQAAAIIANLPSDRAAAMLRAGLRRAGGDQ